MTGNGQEKPTENWWSHGLWQRVGIIANWIDPAKELPPKGVRVLLSAYGGSTVAIGWMIAGAEESGYGAAEFVMLTGGGKEGRVCELAKPGRINGWIELPEGRKEGER